MNERNEVLPVFVYGSLLFPAIRNLLLGSAPDAVPAVLKGFQRRNRFSSYERPTTPAIVRCEPEEVLGELLTGISPKQLAVLDEFEEIDNGLYLREVVSVTPLDPILISGSDGCSAETPLSAFVYTAGPASKTYGHWDLEAFRNAADEYLEKVAIPFMKLRGE